MIFQGIQLFESDAEEASRLAQAPIGSIDHGLSLLPVTLPYPARHHLIELPAQSPQSSWSERWRASRLRSRLPHRGLASDAAPRTYRLLRAQLPRQQLGLPHRGQ